MTTRREIKKNTKYLHDYETTEINAGRRRPRNNEGVRTKTKRLLRSHRDIYAGNSKDKLDMIPTRISGRLSKNNVKHEETKEDEDEQEEENDEVELEGDDDDGDEHEEREEITVEGSDDKEVKDEKVNNAAVRKDSPEVAMEGMSHIIL